MRTDISIRRAAVELLILGTPLARAALLAAMRARQARVVVSADDRMRAVVEAEKLRAKLTDDERATLDLACGDAPDMGRTMVLDTATAWARGGAA